jgi:hypothetical protein
MRGGVLGDYEVRLQLLLKPEKRNSIASGEASDAARRLGMQMSGSGAATLSARLGRADFHRIFGRAPEVPKQGNAGSNAFSSGTDLPIPRELSEHVQSITEAPEHQQFD